MEQHINSAVNAHREWVKRFRSQLESSTRWTAIDPVQAGCPKSCDLRMWLATPLAQEMLGSALGDIHRRHNEFHHAAAFLAKRLRQTPAKLDLARMQQYVDEFDALSRGLIDALTEAGRQYAESQAEPANTRDSS